MPAAVDWIAIGLIRSVSPPDFPPFSFSFVRARQGIHVVIITHLCVFSVCVSALLYLHCTLSAQNVNLDKLEKHSGVEFLCYKVATTKTGL